MQTETLERASIPGTRLAEPPHWQALVTEEGEPFVAFVRGHINPFTLAGDAEDQIIKAFADLSPASGDDCREILDEAGGAILSQFWLRPEPTGDQGGIEYFTIATADQRRAFPVTGVRFL